LKPPATCQGYQVALDTQAHSMQAMHQLLSAETEPLEDEMEDGQLLTKIEAQKTSKEQEPGKTGASCLA